ncbi:MAG: ATP-binding cassette domain-containing protein [Deltaproteobacteria bacterium]|jgi:putative ABC transport system ATP-binding protein|nr:ATP-binding cassette domain-containing protein [Deltaproteobacteria bacterium]
MTDRISQPPTVRLQNVSFAWPGQAPIIDIQELTVNPGETVFLAGPSGSGKSTLLNLIGGLILPQKGDVFLGDLTLSSLSGPARDRLRGDRIGFIFQEFNLLPYLSVEDNVTLPARLSLLRRRRAQEAFGSVQKSAQALLTGLDLEESLWSRKVTALSAGQRQRVAAARALLGRPPLIMADEPTSALDADHRLAFVDLLLSESRKAGAGVLFVSHDRSLADRFSVSLSFSSLGLKQSDNYTPAEAQK